MRIATRRGDEEEVAVDDAEDTSKSSSHPSLLDWSDDGSEGARADEGSEPDDPDVDDAASQ